MSRKTFNLRGMSSVFVNKTDVNYCLIWEGISTLSPGHLLEQLPVLVFKLSERVTPTDWSQAMATQCRRSTLIWVLMLRNSSTRWLARSKERRERKWVAHFLLCTTKCPFKTIVQEIGLDEWIGVGYPSLESTNLTLIIEITFHLKGEVKEENQKQIEAHFFIPSFCNLMAVWWQHSSEYRKQFNCLKTTF